MGQMATMLSERPQGSLPNTSVVNPRGEGKEHCKAITLRSGREVAEPGNTNQTFLFNLSTRTRQYLGTHTFLGESFPAFLNSINALRSKLVVLTEATGGKGSSSISIISFLSRNLSIPVLILSCMTFLKPQHALAIWFHELWYL